ncbi:MAG: sigma-70 family RNA polymerase sigma factor [Planctomycetota bacterium]|nr:sigma-70 family RNA polymerase sigma factor [Planctomycetota bacterium]
MAESPNLTSLLERSRGGDAVARDELLPLVYDELRALAAMHLGHERRGHTLQATALVHEAWIKLSGLDVAMIREHGHFLALAGTAMRRILVNHAEARNAQKRGGDRGRVTLFEAASVFEERADDILDLDSALTRLAAAEPEKARIVELRFFAGLSNEETAEVLALSTRSVERGWRFARAWLARDLGAEEA